MCAGEKRWKPDGRWVDTLVEVGPGNVLSGLAKRAMRGVTSHQLANAGDLGL